MPRPPDPLPSALPWQVFTSAEARNAGVSSDRLKRGDLTRLRRGLQARKGDPVTEASLAAAICRHEGPAVVVGLSAARLLGMPLPRLLESWSLRTPLHVSIPGGRNGSDRVIRWHDFAITPEETQRLTYRQRRSYTSSATAPRSTLRVTNRARTWRDLAQNLPHVPLVTVGDHLVRTPRPDFEPGRELPWCTLEELRAVCTGRHAQALRRALADIRIGSDSPMETLLRLAFIEAGLPEPLINKPLIGADGRARHDPDFQWPQYRVCVEYEGASHKENDQVKRDIRRARQVKSAGWAEIRLYEEDTRRNCAQAIRLVRDELRERGWRP